MSTLRTSMIIDLAGNLSGRASQFLGSMQRLGSGGSRSMQILSRSVHAVGQGLDRLGNRYTALLTGAAGVGAAKQVADLEERFTRLGIDANKSAEEIAGLKKQIFETAKAPEIRVDPGQITGAVEEIIQKTGDLEFARKNIRNIGLAISATAAEGKDIGGIMAEFQKMGILDPKQTLEVLDTLIVQGKEGAFTLKELAALGPRVITAYTSKGRGGVGAIREMGAALQMIRMGTGDSAMAATAFENLMKTFSDNKKLKQLQAGGVQVFDPEAAKRGEEIVRPVHELMAEIIRKSKGKATILNEIFDAEAIRAFNQAAGEFKRTGKLDSLERFYNVQADGTTITKDSIRAARTFNAALTNLLTVWRQFADEQLTGPIKSLTEYLDGLQPGTVERWMKMAKYAALVGAGVIVARKGFGIYQAGRDFLSGGKGKGGGLPGLGGSGGPIPVYVVNKHLSMLPGQGWGFPGGQSGSTPAPGGSGAGKVLGTVGKYAKYAGAVGAVGAAAYGAGTLFNKYVVDGTAFGNFIGEGLNRIAAALGNKESKLAIEINSRDGSTARVTKMQSRGMAVNVDSGLTNVGY